jgi:hypothetical protein
VWVHFAERSLARRHELSPKTLLSAKLGFDYADYDGEDLALNHLYDYMGTPWAPGSGTCLEKIIVFPSSLSQSFLEPNDPVRDIWPPEAPDVSLYAISLGVEGISRQNSRHRFGWL